MKHFIYFCAILRHSVCNLRLLFKPINSHSILQNFILCHKISRKLFFKIYSKWLVGWKKMESEVSLSTKVPKVHYVNVHSGLMNRICYFLNQNLNQYLTILSKKISITKIFFGFILLRCNITVTYASLLENTYYT